MLSASPLKAEPLPRIALIIDDMGLSYELGQAAVQLSGAVTIPFYSMLRMHIN